MVKKLFVVLLFLQVGITNAQNAGILREYWSSISGTEISALTNNPAFPCNPSGSSIETSFRAPINWSDNYGTRMRGFVTAPVTGNYVFWISGDDNCQLWLSLNENPLNKILIAHVTGYTDDQQWTKYPEQKSVNILLESGKRYYIEAIQKEGSSGDNLAVGWQLPDGTLERPVGNTRLTHWPIQENYSTWNYSTPIIFNTSSTGANIQNDVTNFPVLIKFETEKSIIFQQALPNGEDIRFAGSDGNPLSYEIVNWNNTLKQAEIWVKVSRISGASNQDRIYMYWGKSDALPKSEADAVFSYANGFSNVWHLDDNASNPKITDATGHFATVLENNSSWENTSLRHAAGIAGGAIDFQGTNRIPLYNFTPIQNDNEFTISMWVYADVLTNAKGIWFTPEWNSSGKVRIYGNNNWNYENGAGTQTIQISSLAMSSNWINLVVTQKVGGNCEFYVNGDTVGSQPYPAKGARGGNSFIGSEEASNYFDGKIDEVTYSRVSRNSDWIKLWYESQKSSQKLYTIGEPAIAAPSLFTATNMNGTEVALSWNDNSNSETGFVISKYQGNSAPVIVATVNANATSYIDLIGTICGEQIVYMIKAISNYSESATVESDAVFIKPCAPVDLQAAPISENEILISWNGDATFVLEGKKQTDSTFTQIYSGAGSQYNHQGLQCQCTMHYRVKAVNPAGFSDWVEITARTNDCTLLPPANLIADNSGNKQIILTWDDVSSNEDGFKIYKKKEGESIFTEIGLVQSVNDTGKYLDTNLLCNTLYNYYVVAYDSATVSGASNTVSTRTLNCGNGKTTSNMVSINGMYLDASHNPVTGTRLAVVKLFNDTNLAATPLYEEPFTNIEVKNGYFSIPAGLNGDLVTVIRNNNSLYYDVIIDGVSVFNSKAQPLTASPYSIKNSYNLSGSGMPNILGVDAPVGATWVDTTNRLLFVKYGSATTEWKQIGN